MTPQLLLLLAYSVFLAVLGIWLGRAVRDAGDFFVATRRLGPGLLFSTVLAANIGAGSTVGATGLAYQEGVSAWWWNGSAALGSLLLAWWIGPRIWRMATRHGFFTVGDFLEYRYGRGVRGAVALLLWLGTLSILAGQLLGLAWILNVVAGVPKAAGCVIGAAVMTTYFTAGGLLGSARINLVQLVVLLGSFAVALPVLLLGPHGWATVRADAALPPGFFDFWGGSRSVGLMVLLLPPFIVSPGLLQKAYGAADERGLRIGIGASGAVLALFAFVPALVGVIARAHFPHLAHPELALPTVLTLDLPAWAGALALAAIFSAEVSTSDAILFMLSTSLSQDLYRRFLNPAASDRQLLRVARFAALAGGALGVALAIVSPSVIAALTIFYALVGVSLFVPVVAGLHLDGLQRAHAIASLAAGIPVFLVVHAATGGRGYGVVTPSLAGLAASGAGVALAWALGSRARARR